MAEGVMKKMIEEHGLDNWVVDSAGIGNWHVGELPDRRAIQCAENHGIDIRYQRARHLQKNDLDAFDHILVMDLMNYRDVVNLAQNGVNHQKIKLLLEYKYPNEQKIVPDPYYTDLFEDAYQLIYEGCEGFVHHQLSLRTGINKLIE